MKVKVYQADISVLQDVLNEIGYENVLNIIPTNCYGGCILLIVAKGGD